MLNRNALLALVTVSAVIPAVGQSIETIRSTPAPVAATAATVIPALVRYSGVALRPDGKPWLARLPLHF